MRTILRTVRKRTKKTIRYNINSPDYMYLIYCYKSITSEICISQVTKKIFAYKLIFYVFLVKLCRPL